jgi:hypothetical protein
MRVVRPLLNLGSDRSSNSEAAQARLWQGMAVAQALRLRRLSAA